MKGRGEIERVGGFTLVELLVTVAVIVILASLLLPGLSKAREEGRRIACTSNVRQFAEAWLMYAGDRNDLVPPNDGDYRGFPTHPTWVHGFLTFEDDNPDNTNTIYLAESLLSPYLGRSYGLWRCPSDQSAVHEGGTLLPRVRSYSMNNWLNTLFEIGYDQQPYKEIRSTRDMIDPAPCRTFVITDEREDSIVDSRFRMDMFNGPASLTAIPSNHHNHAGNFVFADGHVETHRWRDSRTEALYPDGIPAARPTDPANADVVWLQTHTTGLRTR